MANEIVRYGGGTVLVDGTSKWEVRKIGNAEELNGQAIEDFKNELLAVVPEQKIYSTVLLSSGEMKPNGTSTVYIPLPSGYTRSQCKYAIWSIGATNMSINQSTGAVICYNYGVNSGDQYTPPYGISFGYICIAVK